MELLTHSLVLAQRGLRNLARQPWYVALTLVQPLVWLLLYGQLFKRVVELPGFQTTSYMTFLAPGVIVMTAMFSGGWNGMGTIVDIDRGVMDRLLISPVNRMALILGRLLSLVAVTVIQSVILLTVGFLLGARFAGGSSACSCSSFARCCSPRRWPLCPTASRFSCGSRNRSSPRATSFCCRLHSSLRSSWRAI